MTIRDIIRRIIKMAKAKNLSCQRTPAGYTTVIDGACGVCKGEIITVNRNSGRKACGDCGRQVE